MKFLLPALALYNSSDAIGKKGETACKCIPSSKGKLVVYEQWKSDPVNVARGTKKKKVVPLQPSIHDPSFASPSRTSTISGRSIMCDITSGHAVTTAVGASCRRSSCGARAESCIRRRWLSSAASWGTEQTAARYRGMVSRGCHSQKRQRTGMESST